VPADVEGPGDQSRAIGVGAVLRDQRAGVDRVGVGYAGVDGCIISATAAPDGHQQDKPHLTLMRMPPQLHAVPRVKVKLAERAAALHRSVMMSSTAMNTSVTPPAPVRQRSRG
jgi:hypothetical protein